MTDPLLERRRDEPDPIAVGFVLQLARALHAHGYSAQRLENILGATSDRLGLHGHRFFSMPTQIMAAFGPEARQRTALLRVEPGEVNLGKLAALEQVSLDVANGRSSPQEGMAEIARIAVAPSAYGPVLTTISFGVLSGAVCQFLGGGWREIFVAAVLGLGLGLFALYAEHHQRVSRVFETLAAFLISLAGLALARLVGPLSVFVATLAGLIVLMPGLLLTTAITELATRHLASGTLRLSSAFMTLLGIVFGVALGTRVGIALFGTPVNAFVTAPLPSWAAPAAIILAAACSVVILRADPRDAPWIVAAGVLGVVAGRFGAAKFGPELGMFVAAFGVALASSAFERWLRRPAPVVLVPGILLLVPGSIGYRSMSSLMERNTVAGIDNAFTMLFTAVSLVAGLLIAGVIAPEPRPAVPPKS
ncbi:MAG TPA: threonine/serine exporter family protein [Gemmatimonadaceae bacterium]|nr:threonine/serine exporter family protein [Gemmatimonadaceae bacterium]